MGIQAPYSLTQRDIERELLPMAESAAMSLAAWSPLAGDPVGQVHPPQTAPGASRITADALSERDLAIARTSRTSPTTSASPRQVAIAWTMARSPAVHPIVGARRLDQLVDNLGAVDCHLDAESLRRLDDASAISLGFPHDFIRETAAMRMEPPHERVLSAKEPTMSYRIDRIAGQVMPVNSFVVHGPDGLVVVDGMLTVSDAASSVRPSTTPTSTRRCRHHPPPSRPLRRAHPHRRR